MVDTMTDLPGVRFSWIGLDDIAVEGTFRCITREPLSFNLMAPHGTDLPRNCVFVRKENNPVNWDHVQCFATNTNLIFVVEYDCPST